MAEIVFSFQGTMTRMGYATPTGDPLGYSLNGATVHLEILLPDQYSNTFVHGTPAARAISDSLTLTTSAGTSVFQERHGSGGASGILFSPNYHQGGQFLTANANNPQQYESLYWQINGNHTLSLQRFLNVPSNYVAGITPTTFLDESHFGQLISNEAQLFLNGPQGNDVYHLNGNWEISPASVPEPTTTALFGIGGIVAVIGEIRRRRLRSRRAPPSESEPRISA